MAYRLEIKHNNTLYDVSNWVTDLSDFQYYARNLDYSLISDDMDFKLSHSYREEYPELYFDITDPVYIYSASVLLFNGTISEMEYNFTDLQYEFEAIHKIQNLDDYYVNKEDFSASLARYVEGYRFTELGVMYYDWISLNNLIKAIFNRVGLSLDTSEIQEQLLENTAYLSGSRDLGGSSEYPGYELYTLHPRSKPISTANLLVYIPQLYCVNQPLVLTEDEINRDENHRRNRITLKQLLEKLNSVLGYVFIPKNSGSFYAVNDAAKPTRAKEFDEDYTYYSSVPDAIGVKASYMTPRNFTGTSEPPYVKYTQVQMYEFIPVHPLWPSSVQGWYKREGLYSDNHVYRYETGYGNTVDDSSTLNWYNHLIFWEFITPYLIDGYAQGFNLFRPNLNGIDGLLNRPAKSLLGTSLTEEYESKINTERKAAVENYITINNVDGGANTSKIKTTEFFVEETAQGKPVPKLTITEAQRTIGDSRMIFGESYPKFVSGSTTVLLEESVLQPNYVNRNIIKTKSIYHHYQSYDSLGDYSDFNVRINLWKYTSPESPTTKFNEIYPYLYKRVHFWPHEDGLALSGSDGEAMEFFIDRIQHSYLTDTDARKDVLDIHFKSVGYTDISNNII